MEQLQDVYAQKAISQIPRLLGNMDRNPYSPTYGCFHRDYWLDKTSDFPDAVRQFGVHALALVYKYDFPDNIYKGNEKVKQWTIAAMLFWCNIQHKDGSFDEFYPYERGWVGPTAFTLYTIIEAYNIIENEMQNHEKEMLLKSIKKAAYFITKGETEKDDLANHHAMACLAVWKSHELLNDDKLKERFSNVWNRFLDYHFNDEGWSLEYDGVDPGYLSATVSFLGKVYKTNPDPEIYKVLEQSVHFSSHFVYPNGFYAGSAGSRNTLHFYPHGYEILGDKIPMANAIAQKMLKGLSEDKLVPPEIISDRYVFYRVPEFLLAYLDYKEAQPKLPPLPYENKDYNKYFSRSKIFAAVQDNKYILSNLAKGGVIKVFDLNSNKLIMNDCGIIGKLNNGTIVTSQFIDDSYNINGKTDGWSVEGCLNTVPSNKLFTPLKNIIFRTVLLLIGWNPALAHYLKGQIRKSLIFNQKKTPVRFKRTCSINNNRIDLKTEVHIQNGKYKFTSLSIGDEFFVRYVPQSRYFQSQELEVKGYDLNEEEIKELNDNHKYIKNDTI
jgi:hypothetical protein